MSKSQLNAFLTKVAADPALKTRVDAAADTDAVVAIALSEGHLFSPATLNRAERG
ncbi:MULTISPECIES: Nif11-like leader peptide family natural product precursor [unclassified Cyanobium]|uniref:Nif11-like leader peptide family natural product precursor n=1 Tax=unclassified Cyanobium TaxID=2627006 RepID=UPI0020CF691F|nr:MULTISPECIES: Nif11-like leader peptide family natural product precursor [unclassified Cyanobium]MCP9859441.1 Nif11-like leader peptide family natural product precursor [Cyanobium sp. Cruz-8H5]MCP9866617.1 Nif11-like leader peptide family natural product precursor [Cyanobium sp. Cruz-8D1]